MKGIRGMFLNRDGGVRTTLQIVIAACTFLFISMTGQSMIGTAVYNMTEAGILPKAAMESYFWSGLFPETLLNFFAAGLLLLLYRLMNRRPLRSIGIPCVGKKLGTVAAGMGFMFLVLAGIAVVFLVLGDVRFEGITFPLSILQYFLLMSSVSFVEETLNRGYIQHLVYRRASVKFGGEDLESTGKAPKNSSEKNQNSCNTQNTSWTRMLPAVLSVLIPSLVFLSFHLQNPGITKLGLLNIFLAGVFFSTVTCKIGNIWFAFGAHLIWNAGSACLFGLMSVSATTGSVLNFTYLRETIFNGYGQSPLYGLVATIMWILMTTLCIVFVRRRSEKN